MDYGAFLKSAVMTLIASIVITVMFWFFLSIIHIDYVVLLTPVLGLYIFAVFGTNRLVDEGIIENGGFRIGLAIIFALIYLAVFYIVMPLIFGANCFDNFISILH